MDNNVVRNFRDAANKLACDGHVHGGHVLYVCRLRSVCAERYYSGHVLPIQTVTLSVPAVRPATHSLHSQGRLRSICASAARRDGGMGCARARQRQISVHTRTDPDALTDTQQCRAHNPICTD